MPDEPVIRPDNRVEASFGLTQEPSVLPHWEVRPGLTPYAEAVDFMTARVEAIRTGQAPELIWLLEHPPLYTAGVSAKAADLIDTQRFPVFESERGGQYTYHGPGQRVCYVMLDLTRRRRDVRAFIKALESWIIEALLSFNIEGHIRAGRVGVWVERRDLGLFPPPEAKIAAIGVKLRSHFGGIVPCGIAEHGVTSLVDLGRPVTMDEVDAALKTAFERGFGPVAKSDQAES